MMKEENLNLLFSKVASLIYEHFEYQMTQLVDARITATVDDRVANALETLGAVKVFDETLRTSMQTTIETAINDHTDSYEHHDTWKLKNMVEKAVENVDLDTPIDSRLDKYDFDAHIEKALREFDFDDTLRDFINDKVTLQVE